MMCAVFLVWEHSKMWVNSGVGNYSWWLESSGSIFSLCLMGDAGCQLEPQQDHHQNTHTHGLLMWPGLPNSMEALGVGSAFLHDNCICLL